MDDKRERPSLRLIKGGLDAAGPRGTLAARIVVAAEDEPPFPPDAVVVEQDRDLVLAPPRSELEEPDEPVGRLMMRVMNQQRRSPGGVVVAGGFPLTLFAVVHDIDADPTWREDWITRALNELFRIAARHQLARVAMPLLGTVHGRLRPERGLNLLLDALGAAGEYPERIWLQVPAPLVEAMRALLRRAS